MMTFNTNYNSAGNKLHSSHLTSLVLYPGYHRLTRANGNVIKNSASHINILFLLLLNIRLIPGFDIFHNIIRSDHSLFGIHIRFTASISSTLWLHSQISIPFIKFAKSEIYIYWFLPVFFHPTVSLQGWLFPMMYTNNIRNKCNPL